MVVMHRTLSAKTVRTISGSAILGDDQFWNVARQIGCLSQKEVRNVRRAIIFTVKPFPRQRWESESSLVSKGPWEVRALWGCGLRGAMRVVRWPTSKVRPDFGSIYLGAMGGEA